LEELLVALNKQAEDPDLWNDTSRAQSIMRARTVAERKLAEFKALEQEYEDNLELVALAEEEDDPDTLVESERALASLRIVVAKKQLESLLSGEADGNDCFMEIHAGAGGTESQDWAQMLVRMYTRWADVHDYKVEWLEESPGEEAGIKSTTLRINGENAYGWLKTESGVHRLVRISPYDSSARRHTSFASAWIYPVIHDDIEIEIDESKVRIDTYRASGAGGQHVNKTDSAVRITHIPTGIAVISAEKSQHVNRVKAMTVLRSRLYNIEAEKARSERAADRKSQVGSGDRSERIRTYNFPQGRVTDHRVNLTLYSLEKVIQGEMDEIIDCLITDDQANKLAEFVS